MTSNSTPRSRRILLGVGAGIAAYKACLLIRLLRQRGDEVQVVMTKDAAQFVTPISLQALSGNPVHTDLFEPAAADGMDHISLARWADAIVIAPATADLIAKIALGIGNDLLSTLCLARSSPALIAPGMNVRMWQSAACQRNCEMLTNDGYSFVGPGEGEQACGEYGPGRMSEPEEILAALDELLSGLPNLSELAQTGSAKELQAWREKRILITLGPTHEPLDAVRYLANKSSGRMGLAMAQAALAAGAEVELVCGPVDGLVREDIVRLARKTTWVKTALQMHDAVIASIRERLPALLIATAAVADFRPAECESGKIKKDRFSEQGDWQPRLIANPDILAEVTAMKQRPLVLAFAAETDDVLANARNKRKRKQADWIAVNDVSDPDIGFGSQDNAITLISAHAEVHFPRQPKATLARDLLAAITPEAEQELTAPPLSAPHA